MAKAKYATKHDNFDTMTVEFRFLHGPVLSCCAKDLPNNILECMAIHGIRQKVGDKYSSGQNIFTSEQAYVAANELWQQLVDGNWKAARGTNAISDFFYIRAIAQIKQMDVEAVSALWMGMDADQLKGFKADTQTKAVANKLWSESLIDPNAKSNALDAFNT